MGVSETVLAAMIGAGATISTALFQLVNALRANKKNEIRPRPGNSLRTYAAVLVLMIASGGGGFLYSELLRQRSSQDLQAMRDELNAKLQTLATTTERLASMRENNSDLNHSRLIVAGAATDTAPLETSKITSEPLDSAATPSSPMQPAITQIASNELPLPTSSSIPTSLAVMASPQNINSNLPPTMVESVIYAAACQAPCSEAHSQRTALCGAIPNKALVQKMELFVRRSTTNNSWEESKAELDQDLGGAKFSGPLVEYPQDANRKTVCINFMHWSDRPHIARLVLQYGLSAEPAAINQTVSSSPVMDKQPSLPTTQAVL